MAKREKVYRSGGTESSLDKLALFFLIISVIAVIVCFGVAAVTDSGMVLLPGLASLIMGVSAYVILGGAAEIIRLLKRQIGLPYSGIITRPDKGLEYLCSECNCTFLSYADRCPRCLSEFEQD